MSQYPFPIIISNTLLYISVGTGNFHNTGYQENKVVRKCGWKDHKIP